MLSNTFIDQLILSFDTTLRGLIKPTHQTHARKNPSAGLPEARLSAAQKSHIAGSMRVNHAGEVSAQALYHGQALTARKKTIKTHLLKAADEEQDHLVWCEQRLNELKSPTSVFNPLWYTGSFLMGALAGVAGDTISLGFLAETEKQVTQHLQRQSQKIPAHDLRTHAILQEMIKDESSHAQSAVNEGGRPLPRFVRVLMRWSSRLLTVSSYYL
jgi:ubiquinone biosynthesis monooxygenase Coq7